MQTSEIAVIGSGPGGALSAALLAEAGRDVVLLERGEHYRLDSCEPFTQLEMMQKYRNSGVTVAMGNPKVAYVEGSCVGGGSEVNAGLYLRPPEALIDSWRQRYRIVDLTESNLAPYFEANERDLSISYMPPGTVPPASLKLHEGAQALGWSSMEIPRWFSYSEDGTGTKQSMTETMVPRALASGARLRSGVTVQRLRREGPDWLISGIERTADGQATFELRARHVFVCSGAIATPALLQRSGLSTRAGRTLRMHPSIKLVARFNEQVNHHGMGVPVHQVKEFSPRFGFGCSISTPPYLALAMIDVRNGVSLVQNNWQNMAIYYAMVTGGQGSVKALPFFEDPLVRFRMSAAEVNVTLDALERLGECLFAAGANEVYPAIQGSVPIRNLQQLRKLRYELTPERINLMTIHLFSSCPMGEIQDQCVTDSFGRLHGTDGLYVNDASLLPTAPGVNPQGSVMAIARRNIDHFLHS